ncbi:MAG: hypothetical protein WCC86_06580 [Methanoregula sp.]|uniref:hypothetical protein n=1 Tax=Methanoregula sp. TaxID=2052170 RepID=UPI003BAF2836
MTKKFPRFIWQFVIGFGFLSGLWTSIGIDPEGLIIAALGSAATKISSDPAIRVFFILLPLVILIISVVGAYRKGRVPGLIAVFFAYGAGLVILLSTLLGLLFLLVAIVIAYNSTKSRRR